MMPSYNFICIVGWDLLDNPGGALEGFQRMQLIWYSGEERVNLFAASFYVRYLCRIIPYLLGIESSIDQSTYRLLAFNVAKISYVNL